MDKDRRNTVKIVSTIISLGIIAALIIGVVSVIKNVNANRNESGNIVNLNETEENVAMKTEDAEENIDESDAQDELLEANARGRMAEKNESVQKNNDELMISDKEDTTMQEEATVPPTLSSEEVMAEAMRSFTFDESNKLAWPVLGHITLDYSMDETVLFKSLDTICRPIHRTVDLALQQLFYLMSNPDAPQNEYIVKGSLKMRTSDVFQTLS